MNDLGARRFVERRALLVGAASTSLLPLSGARAQGRPNGVALVIGNSKYQWEASLPNVRRDAPDVARRFQAMGLKTELVLDAGQTEMRAAVDKFAAAARGADFAAFYFAGHGASWDKDTYLVPIDADLGKPELVRTLLPVAALSAATRDAAHRFLVFDNCRNNPADGWRQRNAAATSVVSAAELAATALNGPNTLVVFSTAPGRVALDGPSGENSPFAAAVLRQLEGQSIDLTALPARLRRDLLIATDGQQVVWSESTYAAPYAIKGAPGGAGVGASPTRVASSRILELPKAYAFAQEKKLTLPPGLVAIRSANGGPNDQKIGTFESTMKVRIGARLEGVAFALEPLLFAVLSVDDGGGAQTIMCSRTHSEAGTGGVTWGFIRGQVSGDKIEFNPSPFARWAARWKDSNSGSFDVLTDSARVGRSFDRFRRLDG